MKKETEKKEEKIAFQQQIEETITFPAFHLQNKVELEKHDSIEKEIHYDVSLAMPVGILTRLTISPFIWKYVKSAEIKIDGIPFDFDDKGATGQLDFSVDDYDNMDEDNNFNYTRDLMNLKIERVCKLFPKTISDLKRIPSTCLKGIAVNKGTEIRLLLEYKKEDYLSILDKRAFVLLTEYYPFTNNGYRFVSLLREKKVPVRHWNGFSLNNLTFLPKDLKHFELFHLPPDVECSYSWTKGNKISELQQFDYDPCKYTKKDRILFSRPLTYKELCALEVRITYPTQIEVQYTLNSEKEMEDFNCQKRQRI